MNIFNNFTTELASGSTLMHIFDPLEQFAVVPLLWNSILCPSIITNMTIFLALNFFLIHFLLSSVYDKGVYTAWDLFIDNIYILVKSMIKRNTILKRYQYFSILLFLFMFIFISNLVGLIPYSFTVTSSFVVTFFLALTHFIGINIIAIVERKWEFANMFLPSGVPIFIAPILVPIEFISYIARVFSLSIRLFANMMSGHALLKILIGFSWTLLGSGAVYIGLSIFPWIIVTMIMVLELLIAFLQAYVFVILIAIYINDILASH